MTVPISCYISLTTLTGPHETTPKFNYRKYRSISRTFFPTNKSSKSGMQIIRESITFSLLKKAMHVSSFFSFTYYYRVSSLALVPRASKHRSTLPCQMSWALCLIFFTHPWKFTTGNLPCEMSVTPTKTQFRAVKGSFTAVKVSHVTATNDKAAFTEKQTCEAQLMQLVIH